MQHHITQDAAAALLAALRTITDAMPKAGGMVRFDGDELAAARAAIVKAAPPKPREWWAVGRSLHDSEGDALAFIRKLDSDFPHLAPFGPVVLVAEVQK